MSDLQVSPSRTISIAGQDYVLDGSFGTLRAVQEHFGRDVVHVLLGIMDMRLDQVAVLIAIGSGQRDKVDEIGGRIVDEMGGMSREYGLMKTQLFAWLNVAVAPKQEREKKRAESDAIIEKQAMKAPSPSPGPITSESPSAS